MMPVCSCIVSVGYYISENRVVLDVDLVKWFSSMMPVCKCIVNN